MALAYIDGQGCTLRVAHEYGDVDAPLDAQHRRAQGYAESSSGEPSVQELSMRAARAQLEGGKGSRAFCAGSGKAAASKGPKQRHGEQRNRGAGGQPDPGTIE
jgi:hypothetical protein